MTLPDWVFAVFTAVLVVLLVAAVLINEGEHRDRKRGGEWHDQ